MIYVKLDNNDKTKRNPQRRGSMVVRMLPKTGGGRVCILLRVDGQGKKIVLKKSTGNAEE